MGMPFKTPQPSVANTTGAGLTGWGAHCQGKEMQALRSPQRGKQHKHQLEMLALIKACRAFRYIMVGKGVYVIIGQYHQNILHEQTG